MNEIQTTSVLDLGAKYQGNHPDNLTRRTTLARLLVDNRVVRSVDAGLLLFRIWTAPDAKTYPLEEVIKLANERAPRS
jgi:hypothetical protein